ncbi:MAG: nucleotidyl transferase AbiEii/AbiGii toxin family protein [Kiritimatiellae bacterium]|nr:nucleotidyl transferase AbiEii/AbiGii toxin family protein [Kiritimatiellia bacterium]
MTLPTMIQQRLKEYPCNSALEEDHALREIIQETVLAALGRTNFFSLAGFQGGTCLRIFFGLHRFSEDMDFALLEKDPSFDLAPYLKSIRNELTAYGLNFRTEDKSKADSAIKKGFLKEDSIVHLLCLQYLGHTGRQRTIKIKLEVDTCPPDGATYEGKTVTFPFFVPIRTFDLPSLFAGKLHALLCREYVKGRDWYDLLWYLSRKSPVNHVLLSSALDQVGPWMGKHQKTDDLSCGLLLRNRIAEMDWAKVREDVRRFLLPPDQSAVTLWNATYFDAAVRKRFEKDEDVIL